MYEPPAPRIGHAERDRTSEQLREAAALGRIDLDELDERLGRAFAAKTQPELDALLADLRPARPSTPAVTSAPVGENGLVLPGFQPEDPLVLAAGAGSVKRVGRWELPPWVKISPAMGSVKLDCREAVALYDEALRRKPGEALLHFNRAVALEDQGRPMEAIAAYNASLQLQPDLADAHYNAARLHEQLGDAKNAVRHFSAYRRLERRR